ncbi:MAG: hypothetical protein ACUVWO_06015 [Thermodesulfobacteriota bacterium]
MKHFFSCTLLILLSGAIPLAGCAKRIQFPWSSKLATIREPVGAEEILRLPEGHLISFQQLLDDLESSSVIFMGEAHDQIGHHEKRRALRPLLIFYGSQNPTLPRKRGLEWA